MAHHADRDDAIPFLARVELEVIHHARFHGETPPRRLRADVRGLVVAERDAGAAHAVPLSRVEHQVAPAATDIKQPAPGREIELPRGVGDLLLLSLVKGVSRGAKVRARIL